MTPLTDLAAVLAELQSARRFLDQYAKYEGSLTGHIAVVISIVREEERQGFVDAVAKAVAKTSGVA